MKLKKILLVSDFAYPVHAGTERLVFGIAEYFTNNFGIQADILTPNWNSLKEKETVNGVNIFRFPTHDITKPMPAKRVFGFVKAGLKLGKYDIYHGFYTVPPLVSAVVLSKLHGTKSAITLFSTEQLEKNLYNPVKKVLIMNSLGQADFVTGYTWKIEKQLKEKYFLRKQTATTQGWVDRGFKEAKKTKPVKEKIILFVGRITESKGVFVLLEAFARIKSKANAQLVLIGPPYEKERVENAIKELGLEKIARLIGFVSQEELNEWYNKCHVVAVPALHADAFGFSLMEAMAHGKPVITTEGIGRDEKFGGIIVRRNDSDQLAEALLKILSDKKFYAESKKYAAEMVKLFDKKTVMEKYLSIYNGLLK